MMESLPNDDDASFSSHDDRSKTSGTPTSVSGSHRNADAREASRMLRKDSWVQSLRLLSLCVLLVVGYVVATTVYASLRDSEQRAFDNKFYDQSTQIGDSLYSELDVKLQALDTLAVAITSYAATAEVGAWPNIALPEFAYRSASTLKVGQSISIGLQPLVYRENQREWENYAITNQDWIREGFAFQSLFPDAIDAVDRDSDHEDEHDHHDHRLLVDESLNTAVGDIRNISEFIFSVMDGIPAKTQGDLMMPLWQHSPIDNGLPHANYDQYGNSRNTAALDEVFQNRVAVLGRVFELSESYHGHDYELLQERFEESEWTDIWNGGVPSLIDDHAISHSGMDGPALNMWYPVFDGLVSSADRKEVAVLGMTTRWDSFFLAHLPPDPNGLIVVVSNTCDQVFTFEITGEEVIYLGPEDFHEEEFDFYKTEFMFQADASMFTDVPLTRDFCPYTATVYPSTQMRNAFETEEPKTFTIGVAAIFLFTIMVFFLYDFLVERRQKYLAETAQKSNVIVSALFPKIVRDRLFDEGKAPNQRGAKSFMTQSAKQSLDQSQALSKDAPIADLFSNTTVMFGDIAGFTKWSSTRQPTEVFILLETLYAAFDKAARDMGVFKVETIGDCYMAVTGLPVPQDDHHLRMVRFSRHAIQKMGVITADLATSLGSDTTNLSLRVGLHSGPVTAGVLRGEKSRFQLFGDTVNTASRMESTGRPNQIQVSEFTAKLIEASGKSHWMKKRDKLVEAKGKGKVQTYWIKSKVSSTEKSEERKVPERLSSNAIDGARINDVPAEATHNLGIKKSLIDWQVDLLSTMLKRIVAQEENEKEKKPQSLARLNYNKMLPRDEIAEKIEMPELDPEAVKKSLSSHEVELPTVVVIQLEDLVSTIAHLYHNNGFHNYEHACHVTMSANKLLSRIVIPAGENVQEIMQKKDDYTYRLASDPLAQFAIVFSAIVHDLDHDGVSNQQLVKEKNRLATMYNDRNVAEQNSIDLALELLTSASYKELLSCICPTETEYKRFRQLVINCVLATDIFDKDLLALRNSRWNKAFDATNGEKQTDLKATIVIEHIMQAADVAHTMQHWHVYQRWNEKLFVEMSDAFSAGRGSNKDPALGWYEGELWFFDNYIIPLARKLDECGVFGVSSDECLNYALENRQEWEKKGKDVVLAMAKRYKAKQN